MSCTTLQNLEIGPISKPTKALLLIHNASMEDDEEMIPEFEETSRCSLFSIDDPRKSFLFSIDELRPSLENIVSCTYASTEGTDVESCLSLDFSEESVEPGLREFDHFSFLDMVVSGALEGVTQALSYVSNPKTLLTAHDDYGNTALHLAVSTQMHSSLVRTLLQFGADPNLYNFRGQTPLLLHTLSAETDLITISSILLQHGAFPDKAQKNGIPSATPLNTALERGFLNIAQLLVRRGASLNNQDEAGNFVWEVRRYWKMALFTQIRFAPLPLSPYLRPEWCMACEDLYEHVDCGGQCIHCARSCCTNCLKRVSPKLLPETFFHHAPASLNTGNSWTKPLMACTTCRDILGERKRSHKTNTLWNRITAFCS